MQGGSVHVWVYYPCSSRSWCISTITALRRRISCGVPRAPHSACTRVLALAHLSRPRTAHLGSHPARWGPWGQAGTILTPGWAASWPLSPIDLRVLSRVNVDGTKGTAGAGSRARPGWWSSGLERRTKARIPAGYTSSALLGRVLCSAACALALVVSLSTHVALRICMRTEIPRASSGRFDPHARPAEPERAQNSV